MKADNKKKNPIVTGLKILGVLVIGFFASFIAAVASFGVSTSKKIAKNNNKNNNMQAHVCQFGTEVVKPDTDYSYYMMMFSSSKVIVPKPEKDHMHIEITTWFSKLNIELPTDATINCKGSNNLDFTKEGPEGGPVIDHVINDHVTARDIGFADDAEE